MKRILLAVSILALLLPAVERADARTDVSIDFFYNNLGNSGSWVEVGDYGYVWQPSVAVSNSNWRPYADGYWAYTDVGWTWVSYEDFGWATYHYGRWIRLHDRGWFWVPGYEWGPAWVSWRTGGDYVGWAPLPPRGREVVYEGRPVYGAVDIDFDIGPMYYNFIDVRYIGEPVLRERIFEPSQNVTYIERTVNVTNITYNNSTVYNYGPDYNTLSSYSARPIQRLSLQRQTNADYTVAAQSGALTQVQGDKLVVAAPPKLEKPATTVAPKVVKEKIAKPTIERGWAGADPAKIAQIKQKIKSEDPKKVPPPDIAPKAGASAAAAAATPSTGASPATAASPATPATKPGEGPAAGASPATAASPATPAAPAKGKGKRPDKAGSPMPAPSVAGDQPAAPGMMPPAEKGKGRNKNKQDRGAKVPDPLVNPAPGAAEGAPVPPPAATKPGGKGKGRNARPEMAPMTPPATPDAAVPNPNAGVGAPPIEPGDRKGKGKKMRENELPPRTETAPPSSMPVRDSAGAPPPRGGKHQGEANRAAREAAGGVPPQEPPRGDFSAGGRGPVPRVEQPMPDRGAPPVGEAKPGKGDKRKKGGPAEPTAPPEGQ